MEPGAVDIGDDTGPHVAGVGVWGGAWTEVAGGKLANEAAGAACSEFAGGKLASEVAGAACSEVAGGKLANEAAGAACSSG